MNEQEKIEFYQKWNGFEVQFSDEKAFPEVGTNTGILAGVTLGDISYPFHESDGEYYLYARPVPPKPLTFGDEVLCWDEDSQLKMRAFYLGKIEGKSPHLVVHSRENLETIYRGEAKSVHVVSFKHAEHRT